MKISKRLILFSALAAILIAALVFFELRFHPTSLIYYTLGWTILVVLLLWGGNRIITKLLTRFLPWTEYGNIRFFTHLLLGITVSLLVVNGSYALLKYLLTTDPPTRGQLIVMNVYGAILFVPIFSVYFSLHFLKSWRKSELDSEKFQKESIRSQLESLKSHLDPHFLFNNLNILSSLIDRDKQESRIFLDKFAEVYRLILRSKSEDLVSLGDELKFIEAYCFLLQTRFDHSIRFNISIDSSLHNRMLPPMTLQMLIENAIKHSAITETKPLEITVSSVPVDCLEVSNSLLERPGAEENKRGSGLENIRLRYQHFTPRKVRVEKTKTEFRVTVPLLEIIHA
ncbi:MAG TPA: histidine kinase [Cyclobacteriaceae bacterium]|nr:histidine kinase [Cyclobacteriaceae bacterium]